MVTNSPGDDSTPRGSAPRPSIYEVCLQLGALDENTLINQWMFHNGSGSNSATRSRRFDGNTRFKEVISTIQEEEPKRSHSRFGFLTFGFRSKPKRQSAPSNGQNLAPITEAAADTEPSRPPPQQPPRSFFRRSSMSKPDRQTLPRPASFVRDSGYLSVKSRPFFRRKTRTESGRITTSSHSFEAESHPNISLPTPKTSPKASPASIPPPPRRRSTTASPHPQLPIIHDDDSDDDWEEVEAVCDSPAYSLHNNGINPPALYPSPKKRFSFRPSSKLSTITDESTGDIKRGTYHSFSQALPRLVFGQRSTAAAAPPPEDRRSRLSKPPPGSGSFITRNHKGLTISTDNLPKPTSSTAVLLNSSSPTQGHHHRGASVSLPSPPTPGLLKSSSNQSDDPNATPNISSGTGTRASGSGGASSRIVFADTGLATPDRTPPMRMREMTPLEAAQKTTMGYHNQFFVQAQAAQTGPRRGPRPVSGGKRMKRRGSKTTVGRGTMSPTTGPVPFPSVKDEE